MTEHLSITNLEQRHPRLTLAIAATYLEAAAVCLSRHHESPVLFELLDDSDEHLIEIIWNSPDLQTRLAWANETDAIEAGAYGCAIAALELSRGLYAVRRAETLTGADHYVAPVGCGIDDIQDCYRLEISGTQLAKIEVEKRLRTKLKQVKQGKSNLPAIAAVVGFRASLILIQTLEQSR